MLQKQLIHFGDAALGGRERALTLHRDLGQGQFIQAPQHPGAALMEASLTQKRIQLPELHQLIRTGGRGSKFIQWGGWLLGTTGAIDQPQDGVEPKHVQRAPFAEAPMHLMHDDAIQPRTKAMGFAQLSQITQRFQKGILHDILGLKLAAQKAAGPKHDPIHVTVVQLLKCLTLTTIGESHQLSVSKVRSGTSRLSLHQPQVWAGASCHSDEGKERKHGFMNRKAQRAEEDAQ